ncbi:flagellar biosynthesis repressor FlbT [Thermopetrobacter sp. TC1]|uniref:flagellar biosynthesis repressor FlbT n=1 Tax=Thermopetrobacter sp. TC1 TaxID=1495045 RepID=UPI00068D318F|nr:flagellar biosynthesis repressor FlbT [Thermopetrobacter sp. TC1]
MTTPDRPSENGTKRPNDNASAPREGNKPIRISLRAGERIFVNGAVLRVNKKTSIEFLNNVVFLLEQHVMQPEQVTTPLKKLYFIIQRLLIEPANGFTIRQDYYRQHLRLLDLYRDSDLEPELAGIRTLINTGRNFEALKKVRGLFAREAEIMRERGIPEEPQSEVMDEDVTDLVPPRPDRQQQGPKSAMGGEGS